MFDRKHPQLWPDLSRFISSINQYCGRTWDLSETCLAYYRFNEYEGNEDISFKDRSGKQENTLLISGSDNGGINPALPVVLSYDSKILPTSQAPGATLDYNRVPVSAELVPGTSKRLLRPFVRKCFDFSNRDVRFLLQKNLKNIDVASLPGCTFVARICVPTPNSLDAECIFSISEFNEWQTQLSISKQGNPPTSYTVETSLNASPAMVSATVSSFEFDKWYTVIFSVNPTEVKLTAWSMETGAVVGTQTASVSTNVPTTLTDPMLFIGYGDVNGSPNSTFPINGDNAWGKDSKIAELAIFSGALEDSLAQAIATGWSDIDASTHSMLFTNFKSGISSPSIKMMQRLSADALRTYPSISRSGDNQRTGTGKAQPFNDQYTLIFSSSANIRFPDMLPESLFNSDAYGHLTSVDGETAYEGPGMAGPDDGHSFFVSGSWITAPGRVVPGLKDDFQFKFSRHNNVVYGNDNNSRTGLMDLMVPFDDGARPSSVEIIHQPATSLDTTLGFDQNLGDRIAIVVDLRTSTDTEMGHTVGSLRLTGSSPNTGPDERTTVPIDTGMPECIKSIAYFDFGGNTWNIKGTIPKPKREVASDFLVSASLAFAGTTGFAIQPDDEDPLLPLASRGRPTDTFGFPFDDRWKASHGEKLDMSKYISSPFLLEKMVIVQDMDFLESGDECLGYIIRDYKKNSQTLLPHSASAQADGTASEMPARARVDRYVPSDITSQPLMRIIDGFFNAGDPTSDILSYGRFPLMGGVAASDRSTGLTNAALIPTDDNKFSVVSNVLQDGNSSLFANRILEDCDKNLDIAGGETPGGVAFWRCDTFFLMRSTLGSLDRSLTEAPPPATLCPATTGRWWPQSPDNQQGYAWMGVATFPTSFGETYTVKNESKKQTRELITYSQIAHCGYTRSDADSQAHKSGSVWQEVHPLRAGAIPYPMFTQIPSMPGSQAVGFEQRTSLGFPRPPYYTNMLIWGQSANAFGLTGMAPWTWLGSHNNSYVVEDHAASPNKFGGLFSDPNGATLDFDLINGECWGSPHPLHTASFHPGQWESEWVNARWPYNARYNVLGVDDTTVGNPYQVGNEWTLTKGRNPGIVDKLAGGPGTRCGYGQWAQPFKDMWFSGSYETGGGSLISNPTHFVTEADVFASPNLVNSYHGTQDFVKWGGFNVPGKDTGVTLLDAGLRRDLTIQISSGDRFVKLWAGDPTPGALGWCDIPPQIYRYGDAVGQFITLQFEDLRPTSAYLVATASRPGSLPEAAPGYYPYTNGDTLPLSPNLRRLNSGTFTILSDIKNTAKGGAQSGIYWDSAYPQLGLEFYNDFGYEGPSNWGGTTPPDYDYGGFFIDQPHLLPIIPGSAYASAASFSFPRNSRFIHTIRELSPKNDSYRGLGLSSGRSYIRGVVGTVLTDQHLRFAATSKEVRPSNYLDATSGYYGWNGPVGAAHFVQAKRYVSVVQEGDGTPGHENSYAWIAQLLPYALGYDTRAWITWFPPIGVKAKYCGGEFYDTSVGPEPFVQSAGFAMVPTHLANHPPFTLEIMEKTIAPLAKEYVYSSPYLLMPEDKLVLGFQPAIGGTNPGAPRSMNTVSLPYSTCDQEGYQGIRWNDFRRGTCWDQWIGLGYPPYFSIGLAAVHPYATPGDSPMYFDSSGQPTNSWGVRQVPFHECQNKNSLSEQIRQTILKAGHGKLILYGTLLRDNKPLPSELNQPLVTDAVHEAIHYDNPVQDQFLVQQPSEYRGSYLTQYVTGSLLRNPAVARVAATVHAGNLGIDAAFNRFVTIADEGEVYWDSILPNIYDVWTADGVTPALSEDGNGDRYDAFLLNGGNPNWCRAFPFEARYKDTERSLQDPGERERRPDVVRAVNGWVPPGTVAKTVSIESSWIKGVAGRVGIVYAAALANASGDPLRNPNTSAYQSKDTNDKTASALLFGFARTGGVYFAPDVSVSGWDFMFKALNPIFSGYPTTNPTTTADGPTWDHPEGVKYGLKNYVWEPTKMSFRPDRYGQFRDVLEQRRYSKFFHRGNDEIDFGEQDAAVSCIFLDSDRNPVDDPRTTSCQNISTFMTSSIPYFEGTTLRTPPPPTFVSVSLLSPTLLT